jgi:hypothetical protein
MSIWLRGPLKKSAAEVNKVAVSIVLPSTFIPAEKREHSSNIG